MVGAGASRSRCLKPTECGVVERVCEEDSGERDRTWHPIAQSLRACRLLHNLLQVSRGEGMTRSFGVRPGAMRLGPEGFASWVLVMFCNCNVSGSRPQLLRKYFSLTTRVVAQVGGNLVRPLGPYERAAEYSKKPRELRSIFRNVDWLTQPLWLVTHLTTVTLFKGCCICWESSFIGALTGTRRPCVQGSLDDALAKIVSKFHWMTP